MCWRGGSACSFEKLRNFIQGLNQQSIYRLTKWKNRTTFSAYNTKYILHQTQAPPIQKMITCQLSASYTRCLLVLIRAKFQKVLPHK